MHVKVCRDWVANPHWPVEVVVPLALAQVEAQVLRVPPPLPSVRQVGPCEPDCSFEQVRAAAARACHIAETSSSKRQIMRAMHWAWRLWFICCILPFPLCLW